VADNYVSDRVYVEFMSIEKRRQANKLLVCPTCGEKGSLRKIVYGMPDPELFDFKKYAVGGCCLNEDGGDPDIRCSACDWEGFRRTL
jgi:hypothetical protein